MEMSNMAWKKTIDEEEMEKGDSKFPGFLWKPEAEGEKREGVYSRVETIEDADSVMYHFNEHKENPENEDNPKLHWKMWGATILNNWMEKAKPGLKTEIVFLGKQKNKTNKYYSNHYEVMQDEPEEMEGETQLPSSKQTHPANIPKAKEEPEHSEALRFEANGYIRDCQSDTKEEAKDCLIDMLSKRMLVSEYSFSQEQIFKCALNLLAEEDKE
jgi:hypothetical protein